MSTPNELQNKDMPNYLIQAFRKIVKECQGDYNGKKLTDEYLCKLVKFYLSEKAKDEARQGFLHNKSKRVIEQLENTQDKKKQKITSNKALDVGVVSDSDSKVHILTSYDPRLDALLSEKVVAVDVEGVDLSRDGKICLVQIATKSECFILDVLNMPKDHDLICWLATLFQSRTVIKVIHDCRMDSDALYHHYNIELERIHDTSCWHKIISGMPDRPLNEVLEYNDLVLNVHRNSTVYYDNPTFWAKRPLTATMKDWASGDVGQLLSVYEKQVQSGHNGEALSMQYAAYTRNMQIGYISVDNPGLFIGRGGCNVRALQKRTNTLIYSRGNRQERKFAVYYRKDKDFSRVREEAYGIW